MAMCQTARYDIQALVCGCVLTACLPVCLSVCLLCLYSLQQCHQLCETRPSRNLAACLDAEARDGPT